MNACPITSTVSGANACATERDYYLASIDLAMNGHRLSLLFTKSCPAFPSREVRATPVQLRFSRSPPPFAGTGGDRDYSTTAQWRCADTLRPALGSISTWATYPSL